MSTRKVRLLSLAQVSENLASLSADLSGVSDPEPGPGDTKSKRTLSLPSWN